MLESCNLDTFICDCEGNFNTTEKYTETSNIKEKSMKHKTSWLLVTGLQYLPTWGKNRSLSANFSVKYKLTFEPS